MIGALALLPAAFQLGTGIYQGIKGNQLGRAKQPKFEIPKEQQQALGIAENLASQRNLPGQSIIEDKMRSSTASGVNALKGAGMNGSSMQAMVDLFTNESLGLRDLGIAAEEQWIQKQGTLANALEQMAGWQNQKNQYEKYDPFAKQMETASMMKEGALQNTMGALSSGVSAGIGMQNIAMEKDYMDFLTGQGKYAQNQSNQFNPTGNLTGMYASQNQIKAAPQNPQVPPSNQFQFNTTPVFGINPYNKAFNGILNLLGQ